MSLLMQENIVILWQDAIHHAKNRCKISLDSELEAYLISLLIRYASKPEIAQQIFATAFMKAMQAKVYQRQIGLQDVGDQCLLYAGFFPRAAEKKHVKVSYFVDLGRAAYANISASTNDLYGSLALQFVVLMDVLQSIRNTSDMLPLEAYELWQEVGSQRAFDILCSYGQGLPIKKR